MSGSHSAGTILSEAWHAAFGRNPDAEEAYEKAIKAVEEAGAHVVAPSNKKSTLGTMIRDMKAQVDWKLDLPTPDADVPIKMAEALWVGQESRHGGNGYRKPTQTEAEAAVLLAVPLVQWFSSGAIARRP
jgi:nitrous oxide reductase accessory protein NosL